MGPSGAGAGGYGQQGYDQEVGYAAPPGSRAGGYAPPGMSAGSSLKHMQTTTSMNIVFFIAACCIMGGAAVSFTYLFLTFSPADALNMFYMFALGGVFAILDTP